MMRITDRESVPITLSLGSQLFLSPSPTLNVRRCVKKIFQENSLMAKEACQCVDYTTLLPPSFLSFPSPKQPMRSWACWRLATGTGRSTPLMPTPHPHGHTPSFRWVPYMVSVVLNSGLHSGFLTCLYDKLSQWVRTVVRVQVKQVWYSQTKGVNRRFRHCRVWNGCGEDVCSLPGNFQCRHT